MFSDLMPVSASGQWEFSETSSDFVSWTVKAFSYG